MAAPRSRTRGFVEIVGLAGLIASLVFVGLEVRQNAAATRAATAQEVSRSFRDLNLRMAGDGEFVEILISYRQNPEDAPPVDQQRLRSFFRALFHIWSNVYYQNLNGTIDVGRLRWLRKRHRWMVILFWVAAVAFAIGFVGRIGTPESLVIYFSLLSYAGVALGAGTIALTIPFGRQACPRCQKPFYVDGEVQTFLRNPTLLPRACVHCGLSLDEPLPQGHGAAEPADGSAAAGDSGGREE